MNFFKKHTMKSVIALTLLLPCAQKSFAGDLVGLPNVGASCYINVAVQTLYSNRSFVSQIDQMSKNFDFCGINQNGTVCRLNKIFQAMLKADDKSVLAKEKVENDIKNLFSNIYDPTGGFASEVFDKIINQCIKEAKDVGCELIYSGTRERFLNFADIARRGTKEILEKNEMFYNAKIVVVSTGGHFLTYIKCEGKWYKVDDAKIYEETFESFEKILEDKCIKQVELIEYALLGAE